MIPPLVKEAIDRHVSEGCLCGPFTQYVLLNDLAGAVGQADEKSYAALREIVRYVWNEIPANAWGSATKVDAWRAKIAREREAVSDE